MRFVLLCSDSGVGLRTPPGAQTVSVSVLKHHGVCHRWPVQFAKIKPAELPGYSGRCLVALGDIQPGECVVNVPVASALRVYPGCPTALPQIPQPVWSQLPWYVQLALTLLSEQQKGAASKWADYIRLLPGSVDVPVLWSQPQLQQLQCAYFVETVSWGAEALS